MTTVTWSTTFNFANDFNSLISRTVALHSVDSTLRQLDRMGALVIDAAISLDGLPVCKDRTAVDEPIDWVTIFNVCRGRSMSPT